jgi:hypothetical protein
LSHRIFVEISRSPEVAYRISNLAAGIVIALLTKSYLFIEHNRDILMVVILVDLMETAQSFGMAGTISDYLQSNIIE